MLIIHRVGKPHVETAVRITDGRGGQWWIDPQAEIVQATGVVCRRDYCILSFADGLIDAGHDVLFNFRFDGRRKDIVQHRMQECTMLGFYVLGLAWGKNDWVRLKRSLQFVSPYGQQRWQVLTHTARQCLNQPWCRHDPIQLCFP